MYNDRFHTQAEHYANIILVDSRLVKFVRIDYGQDERQLCFRDKVSMHGYIFTIESIASIYTELV